MIVGSVLPSVLATASTIASVYRGTTELEGTAVAPVGAVEDRCFLPNMPGEQTVVS